MFISANKSSSVKRNALRCRVAAIIADGGNDPRVQYHLWCVYNILVDGVDEPGPKTWTARRELIARLPGVLRNRGGDLSLALRVLVAIVLGGQARCNIAMDALIEREARQ